MSEVQVVRGRPKRAIPTRQLTLCIPEPLYAQLHLLLYSDLEGRIPHGKLSEYINAAIEAKLNSQPNR